MSKGYSKKCNVLNRLIRFFRPPHVLCVGATHIDIVGEFDDCVKTHLDRPGNLRYSVGGTAFNIAANLADMDTPITLVTMVRKESFMTPLIIKKLRLRKIDCRFVEQRKGLQEAGFAAHLNTALGVVDLAVTCTPISTQELNWENVRKAMRCAGVVVADCNLSTATFHHMAKAAHEHGLPLVVDGVSESKVKRCIQALPATASITALVAKSDEIAPLLFPDASPPFITETMSGRERRIAAERYFDSLEDNNEAAKICTAAKAKIVVVVNGDHRSYRLYTEDGEVIKETMNITFNTGNKTGIGDGVAAAVAAFFHKKNSGEASLSYKELRTLAEDICSRVAEHLTAVPNAELAYRGDETWMDKVTEMFNAATTNPYVRITAAVLSFLALLVFTALRVLSAKGS